MDEVVEFLNWVNGNEDVKEQLNEKAEAYFEEVGNAKDIYANFIQQEIIPLAQDYGFDFNLEDYVEFLEESDNSILSEGELSGIAGGKHKDFPSLIMPTVNFGRQEQVQ